MQKSKRAGTKAREMDRCNIPDLISDYYMKTPDPKNPMQKVTFGTSGHRGTSFASSFNQEHILAIAQSVCDFRFKNNITGPLFLAIDTHALSKSAFKDVLCVLIANQVEVFYERDFRYTPTPAASFAVLKYNQQNSKKADSLIITPSHNPPEDGGIKYNTPNGGPANSSITKIIEEKSNSYLQNDLKNIKKMDYKKALESNLAKAYDFMDPYITNLINVVDMDLLQKTQIKILADPMGGAGVDYWGAIAHKYNLNLEVLHTRVDPSFMFMHLDSDAKIRMDCSSKYAMSSFEKLDKNFDIAVANDTDFDRHGIYSKKHGLLDPNHFLAIAIDYLLKNRPLWSKNLAIGKTLVSSSIIDEIIKANGAELVEVPVGFKWFVDDLFTKKIAFAGEESAGASFLDKDFNLVSTDKDGFILALLAAEIQAKTNQDIYEYYFKLEKEHGKFFYSREDFNANIRDKESFKNLTKDMLDEIKTLANDNVLTIKTKAKNNEDIGGLKVTTKNGWFAARPSGTENKYKIYAQSFVSQEHLELIIKDAKQMIANIFEKYQKLSNLN